MDVINATSSHSPRRDGAIDQLRGPGPQLASRHATLDGGPPLVLLHGLSAESSSWRPVVDRFADRWRTYAVDFRGHGGSARTPGEYRLADYVADADRLLREIGEPAVVVGHSLGGVVAAELAQAGHPLVAGVLLEDPPLYLLDPDSFAASTFASTFSVLVRHVRRLQASEAPVQTYRDLLAAAPHPAGDTLGDHLYDDALWARAQALAAVDPEAIEAVLDGTTFAGYDPDRPLRRPAMIVRADPRYDPGFRPGDEARLAETSPHVDVAVVSGAAHNIRGDRAGRARFLDVLGVFLARQSTRIGTTTRTSS